MGDGEEEIREDGENGKGETHQRLQPALLLAGGQWLVAGDGEWRRSGGRAPGLAAPAPASVCVQCDCARVCLCERGGATG